MKLSFLFLILLFLFSCLSEVPNKNKVIKIDILAEPPLSLPKIKIQSIISLETNKESLFGNINLIENFSNRIYILDIYSSKSVMVFSNEGSFINKTKFGKGPQEIINPFSFFVDRNEDKTLVYDQATNNIVSYDLDLNFLSRKKYNGIPFLNFAQIDKNKLLVRTHYNYDYVYTLYTPNNTPSKKQYIPDYQYSVTQGLFRAISINKRNLLISPFDYNVYQLTEDKLESAYYIDFGKYKLTKEDAEKKNAIKASWNLIHKGQRVSSLNGLSESNNYLLFYVIFKNEPIHYVYSFNKEKTHRLNDYFEKGVLPKCKILGSLDNDTFYAIIDPLDLIEFQEKNNTKLVEGEIEIQQNPFLITFNILEL